MAYDRLLTSWAHQLESLGLWHWSCFLLLQLSSSSPLITAVGDAHKVHAIRSLIERSLQSSAPTPALLPSFGAELLNLNVAEMQKCTSSSDRARPTEQEMVSFVVNQLHLPRQWIYEAYATRSRYDRDWVHTRSALSLSGISPPSMDCATATLHLFVWLLNAGQTCAAHTLMLQCIAPDAILCGNYSLLGRVLEQLDPTKTDSSDEYFATATATATLNRLSLENWSTGGHVFLLFLSAVRDLPAMLGRLAAMSNGSNNSIDSDINADGSQAFAQLQSAYQQMLLFLATLPSLSARFDSGSDLLGFYDGFSASWFTEEQSRELRVKYSVAISDMASVITGFVQELERCVPGLSSNLSLQNGHTFSSNDMGFAYAAKTTVLTMAQDTRILRTYQMARSYFDAFVGDQLGA
ncbi:hypothetical protein FB639_005700 [Coemansia asiatica]|nr:hypothetical protein FB639_005700 [Coemansia asiatica]